MEWLIPAGTALATLVTTAAVVFRRSLVKARLGGRAKVELTEAEAARIRAAANQRLSKAQTDLPRLRAEVKSARMAGTLKRTAEDLYAQQGTANARARRSAQSFNAALERHRGLLRRLEESGLLIASEAGPTIDTTRLRGDALEAAASVGRHLQELEWYRTNGERDGLSGPLRAPGFSGEHVASLKVSLGPDRVDEDRIHERTREVLAGQDLLTPPTSVAEAVRKRKRLFRRDAPAPVRGAGEQNVGRKR
ncbi:hypothetical protein PWG71_17385 [Nocardiopsis sp. N85]|uniref:hypothetical protein n=1 Tax=Nocardiopsis sp. N85 TaxID=3029400 RepID=UPI00237F690E|nr:hypothetical protein [Nocardiopsis sp. N85]MDE3723168.1 hypothetical protein [Nocardiopsis sp. N85]